MATIRVKATRKNQVFRRAPEVRKKMAAALRAKVKPYLIDKFNVIVADWKNKPRFYGKITERADYVSLFVHPGKNDKIYRYVTLGTKGPYPIPKTPKVGGTLAFKWGGKGSYRPKTTTKPSWRGPGKVVGGVMHFPKQVMHPGIKARNFEEWVAKSSERPVNEMIGEAWKIIIGSL